jgi:hypothetical protein
MVAPLVATPGAILLARVKAVSLEKPVDRPGEPPKAGDARIVAWRELKVRPLRWLRAQPGSAAETASSLVVRYPVTQSEHQLQARAGRPFAATAGCTIVVFLSPSSGATSGQLRAKPELYSLLVRNRANGLLESRLRGVYSLSTEDLVAAITQAQLGVPPRPRPEE